MSEELKKEEQEKDIKTTEDQIEKDISTINDKFGIEVDMQTQEVKVSDLEQRESQIELRLQEIDVEMDKLDIIISQDDTNYEALDKYEELKKESKSLLKEKKNLYKIQKEETYNPEVKNLDSLSVWIIIYGIFVSLFSSPLLSSVWVRFGSWIINIFSDSLGMISASSKAYYPILLLIVFAFPLLLHIISWVLYLNAVKNKTDKFAFRIAWISQAVFTLITMLIALINVLGD